MYAVSALPASARPTTLAFRVSLALALAMGLLVARRGTADPVALSDDGRAGVVTAAQGVAMVRPIGRERWTPLDARGLLFPGDVLRTEARGANALEIRLRDGGNLVVGPGALLELPNDGGIRLVRGDAEVKPPEKGAIKVAGAGGFSKEVAATAWLRAGDAATKELQELKVAPKWLEGYRANTSEEWMGSLLANVDGKNVPLTVGYHKVTVEIRDQIARTTIEESFVNSTDATLEGVFSFPLPADASISGFGMWIGDELVEADLVEKQRARAIYEDILRRKKDPGLLEWEGGNLFKARVFPIWGHSEKRIRLRYTEVLPMEGDAYRYRYALRSELLRLHPLRELSIAVNVMSAASLRDVSSATHAITLRKTDHEAIAEFSAQQYVPERDFELSVGVTRGDGLTALSHRRGDDGFFMLLLAPPDVTAAGWQRDLVPEGDPLDLVLVADTSGSMDPASRATQAAFLAGLLGPLSATDKFRLVACDVEPHWLVEEPTPATEENVAKALAALDARFSLGWTDLDKAFGAVMTRVSPKTQVVYVGDGIPTSRDADPVALSDRLRTMAKSAATGATFHAVSTSSAYEKGVLEAIASIGGGSVRRADGGVASVAKALLGEIAKPGLRDARVTIDGVPTAKVYPEVLPNLPLGQQQVVLGRFLPTSNAGKSASIVVTGTVGGKPVRFTSSFGVPAADDGNSFLPRLWARRHLDALLAQGSSAQVKDEIVSFSREYQIMTPYTSFLVLENDEDRALYGVERTVKMRDAERFFAQARDKAALEVARQQMAVAHRWRVNLRRRILREIATLGRGLPIPAATTWMEYGRLGGIVADSSRRLVYRDGDGRGKSEAEDEVYFGTPGVRTIGGISEYDFEDATASAGGDLSGYTVKELDACCAKPSPAPAAMPESPAELEPSDSEGPTLGEEGAEDMAKMKDWNADGRRDDGVDRAGEVAYEGLEMHESELSWASAGKKAYASGRARAALGLVESMDGRYSNFRAGRREAQYGVRPTPWNAGMLGFPWLGAAGKPPPPFADPTWDPVILKALKSINRRASLASMDGALRISSVRENVHPLRGYVIGRSRSSALVSSRRWHVRSGGALQGTNDSWLSETERAELDVGLRLGRRRAATDNDRLPNAPPPLPLADLSLGDVVRGYARAYRRAPTAKQDGDLVTITFRADGDADVEQVLVVDVARGVLVEIRQSFEGKTMGSTRFSAFVQAGGRSWATKIATMDEDGLLVSRQTLEVEAIDAAAFSAAFDAAITATADALFLGAQEPTLVASQQAIHDGHAEFAHRLVVALDHGARGRFDELWKAWEGAEALVASKTGVPWMRLFLLENSRRGAQLQQHAIKLAAEVAKSDPNGGSLARWQAAAIAAHMSPLGAREQLAVVDAVKVEWTRAGADVDLWSVFGRRREAEAATAAGLMPRARALRAAIAAERPWDEFDVRMHAALIRAGEDLSGAIAYIGESTRKGGRWTRGEYQHLFQTWIGWLWESRDIPGLAAAADAWIAADPREEAAYHLRLSCLYLRGQYDAADREITERLKGAAGALADPASRAALAAALHVAMGQGWSFYGRTIPEEWRGVLAEVALSLARSDARWAPMASTIIDDWRFQQTDEARIVAEGLEKDLLADGAIASMPLRRLASSTRWARRVADAATWKKLTDAVIARWRAATDKQDVEALANLALEMIPNGGRNEERIVFLRENLVRAEGEKGAEGAKSIVAVASMLFDSILSAPLESGREDEAFALMRKRIPVPTAEDDADPADVKSAQRAAAADGARRLATWLHQGRYLALLGKPEDRSKWTRAETVQKTKDARTKAQAETSARFATAVGSADAILRPWLEVERVGYAAETLADLSKSDGEARELLESLPAAAPADAVAMDAYLAERSAAVVVFAATRRNAPTALVDRAIALFHARIEAKDRLLDNHEQAFRLFVALDRAADVEKDLVAWIQPDDVDNRWRLALAWLEAETNRLAEAVKTLEAAAAMGDLDAGAWGLLADGYLVAKEDARRDDALDKRLALQPEWQLNQRVWNEQYRVQRNGPGVPAELDPEVLRVLRFLLKKAESPAQYVNSALVIYRPTKDFRVLECLADGVTGHSPEAVYLYLQQMNGIVAEIHEEATCDALTARLSTLIASATRPVDRRALRLLLTSVESRAAEVPKAEPKHDERALAALVAAFEGNLVPGERVMFAQQLAALGATKAPGLAEEQMRQLERLLEGATEGPMERLAVGRHVTEVLWSRGKRDEATDRLLALLEAARGGSEGTLLPEANEPYSTLIAWWTSMQHFRQAESLLRKDIDREPRSQRREALRMRLFALYGTALGQGGALSIGSRGDLFRVAADEMERYLGEGAAYLIAEAAGHHGALHWAAKNANAIPDAPATYYEFVRRRMPAVLARNPLETLNVLQNTLQRLRDLAGPIPPLTVMVEHLEREPKWFERVSLGAWPRFSTSMAQWRHEAGSVGGIEGRLLAIVVKHLETELVEQSWEGAGFWHDDYATFWREHAADFARVAARVAEVQAARPAVALNVARYQREGLSLHRESIATLQMILANGHDPEDVRSTLALWLKEDNRFAEAWPVIEKLVADRADNLQYRILATAVLHGLGRDPDAEKLLTDTVARWKEKKMWSAQPAAAVAIAALDCGLAKPCAEWMDDALRMRREAGGRGREDAELSRWYQTLARARSLLGETDAAVKAASAAVVAWGRQADQRAEALSALRDVLAKASDFDAWIARYEAEVASTGMDAPIIRKAAGQVLLDRRAGSRAVAMLRAARDLDPADAETHALLVRALDAAGDAKGALDALLTSLRVAPKNLPAYGDVAARFFKAGDAENAERARTSLVEAMPSDPDGYRALALLREANGKWAYAVVAWTGVTRTRPTEPDGWLALGTAQIKAGDADGARRSLKRVLDGTWEERFGDVKSKAADLLGQVH